MYRWWKFGIQLHSLSKNNNNYGISSSCNGVSSSNSDDTTMVHSLFDLNDTSTFYKKQNEIILYVRLIVVKSQIYY